MKSLITGIIAILFPLLAISQSFVKDSITWNVVECINQGACVTHSFTIAGDTIIGTNEFKKLYHTYDTSLQSWLLYGGLRENGEQVYMYQFDNQNEELLYDFNLNIGDTFRTIQNSYSYFGGQIELIVVALDSVMLQNGDYKTRYHFHDGEQWIYGIGSLNGIVYPGVYQVVMDMYHTLSCYHNNNQLLYHYPWYSDCINYTVGIEESMRYKNCSIYPNPFRTHTNLSFDYQASEHYVLNIYDLTGRIIAEFKEIYSGDIPIDASNLTPGMHTYVLFEGANTIGSGKIVLLR